MLSTRAHRSGDHDLLALLAGLSLPDSARAPDGHQRPNWAVRVIGLDPWSVPVALTDRGRAELRCWFARDSRGATSGPGSQLYIQITNIVIMEQTGTP